jgi:catechol 2,3-dioxygenase-like lactoylglutathione lyase family enzyme
MSGGLSGNAGFEGAMIKVRRISHATFETPDLDRALDYYVQVTGLALAAREKGCAFLAAPTGRLAVALVEAPQARCVSLAFEVAPDVDFATMRRGLSAEGIASEERLSSAPGIPKVLSFADPHGTRVELFSEWTSGEARGEVTGVGPLKLGHVAFFSPDLNRIAEFYQRVLGFRVSDWIEDFFVFMRCNPDHHSVNFLRGDVPRVHHFAFELRNVAHIVSSCDVLSRRKTPLLWGPLRFGPGHNVATFHRNPDDQIVEFYTELDQMTDESLGYYEPRPWHRDKPQRPKVWTLGEDMIWGPPAPRGFM